MADDDYTAPTTRATDFVVTASVWNTDIVNNITAIFQGLVGDASADALMKHRHLTGTNAARPAAGNAGRLYYATDDPKCVYLDDGAAWIVVGGVTPRCYVTRATAQSIPNDTVTSINWTTETFDNNAMHENVTAPQNVTIVTPGDYLAQTTIDFDADIDGLRSVRIVKNVDTTPVIVAMAQTAAEAQSATIEPIFNVTAICYGLVAGNTLTAQVRHVAGAAININNSPAVSNFAAVLLA